MIDRSHSTRVAGRLGNFGSRRVLHILEATLGGTRRFLENILDASLPYEMGIAYSLRRADVSWNDLLSRMQAKGWATWNVEMSREIEPLSDLRAARELHRTIRRWSPSIVHCHSAKAGALGRLANAMAFPSRPCIYNPHSLPNKLGFRYRVIEHLLAPLSTRIIAGTPSEREEIVGLGLSNRWRVDVVIPAVDTARFSPRGRLDARSKLNLDATAPLVIGVGRLAPQKNPLEFFEVVKRAKVAIPALTAVWVGDGDLRENLMNVVHRSNAEGWFKITGWLDDPRDYMAACDALVSTAAYEGYGYIVPEALAMGRPVVASRVTGTIDTMDHEELQPWLYPLGDINAATSCVISVLASSTAEHVALSIGRQFVCDSFSVKGLGTALVRSYERALATC